ncbi:MAG: proprotein convertase P-domain-containing protein [Pontixanthobacter sp.]
MRLVSAIIVILYLNSAGQTLAQSNTTDNTTIGAIDATTSCASNNPLVRAFTINNPFTIMSVRIGILATHTWRGDLQFTLQHPDGTRVQLTNGNTNLISGDNFNVLLEDSAAALVNSDLPTRNHSTTAPPYQNTYRPQNPLSAFNGKSPTGTWRLEVCDLFPTADDGQFRTATLTVEGTRTAGVAPQIVCPKGSIAFNWEGRSWPSGSTQNNYTLDGLGAFNWNISSPSPFLNIAGIGGAQPALTTSAQNQITLSKGIDFADRAQFATTTITLGETVDGAQLTVFDVDYALNDFADRLRVFGRRGTTTVIPVLTNGRSNYVIGNEAFGDAGSDAASADGNVVATFQQPVDTIVVEYGNHSQAPANPDGQAIQMKGGISICRPNGTLQVAKTSTVLEDPVKGTQNPFFIPGATTRYCILITNVGSASAGSVQARDVLPANITYIPETIRSGTTCANASTVEDDNAAGADETDPAGANFANGTVTMTQTSIAGGGTAAFVFRTRVN